MAESVQHLFVTLRRSFAGCRSGQISSLRTLGFSYREQLRQLPNTASMRGAIAKVSLAMHKLYGMLPSHETAAKGAELSFHHAVCSFGECGD